MLGYVEDDGGRAAAGYKGYAGDCVARALAILTGRPYTECYKALADGERAAGHSRSARNGVSDKVWPKVYQDFGLVKVKRGKGAYPTYTEAHEQYGDCIVTTNHHVAALMSDGLHDIFDGRTYEWLERVCEGCERAEDDLDGSGTNGVCSRCGEEVDVYFLVAETRERKARSIWVKAG